MASTSQPSHQDSTLLLRCHRKLPLYDLLVERLNQRISQGNFSITSTHKARLCAGLNSLSRDQAEQVTILIIHYLFINTELRQNLFERSNRASKNINLPYGMKMSSSGKGFSFNLDLLPVELQALLCIYCNL